MSVALQIREVPEAVRDVLASRAAASGRSLQAYLLEVVTREAALLGNLAILDAPLPGGGVRADLDYAALVRESRTDRDDQLSRASGPQR